MVREAGPILAPSWLWLGKHPLLVPKSCLAVIYFFAYSSFIFFISLLHTLVLSFPIAFACRLACSITSVPGFWWTLPWHFLSELFWCEIWITPLIGYFAKFRCPVSEVYIAVWLYCQIAKSTLVIWLFCKFAKSTSKMSFELLTNQKVFWAVQGTNFLFWSPEISAPKKPDNPWFFKFSFPEAAYSPPSLFFLSPLFLFLLKKYIKSSKTPNKGEKRYKIKGTQVLAKEESSK